MSSTSAITPQAEENVTDQAVNTLETEKPKRKRRSVLWIVCPILIILAAAFYWFLIARPVGSGPAGPSVDREPFQSVWSERNILLLGLGDSITAGFGMPKGYGYVDWMLDNPPDEFPEMEGVCLRKVLPNIELMNLSVSGSTSIDHANWFEDRIPLQESDVFGLVVMTSGGNDLIHSYGRMPPKEGAMYGASLEQAQPWIENFRKRLGGNIKAITAKFPGGCAIFMADIYDPTDGVGDAVSAFLPDWPDGLKILDAYNAILREAADEQENVFHVPLHATYLGHGTHCTQFWRKNYRWSDPTYWYGANLEDPNIRGFDAVRRIFLIEMADRRDLFE